MAIPFAAKAKTLKVLFIGNSYTFVNNLPQMVADVSSSMGDTLIFDSYTVGGYAFSDHSTDPLCAAKINSQQWDYVILQEQSLNPSEPSNIFFDESYYAARNLDNMIKANDPCTKNIFYMTWGYKDGFASSCGDTSWPYRCTYESMDSLTNLRYRAYADTNVLAAIGFSSVTVPGIATVRSSLVSPVGAVRHYIRHNYPTIELYQSDGSHPTKAGTYAAACTFYVILFHKDPTLISYNATLADSDAENIRYAAKLIAYDSMSKWYIGTDLRAQFTDTANIGNTVSFTNTSTSATSYLWDFGDSNTSTSPDPTHTYTSSGTYAVRLIAFNSSCSDTTYATVNTSPTSVGNVTTTNSDFIIWPNPAKDMVNIQSSKSAGGSYQLHITDALGKEVYFKENISAGQQINVANLNSGIYFITIKNGNNVAYRYKLLKL